MKVVCDFLPQEYKSFVLDVRALGVLVALTLGTAAFAALTHFDYDDKVKGLNQQIRKESDEISNLDNKINSKSYNQSEIQELIDKFNFIKEAVGARDFPYLRFYHALERAIPIGEEDGSRRVALKAMTEGRDSRYQVQGLARHWDDLIRFEQNLNNSKYEDKQQGQQIKNFSDVKMGGWTRSNEGISFTCEFTFLP